MHGRLDAREIGDIGDTALSFSEVKALATGNPLLMDKAEADTNLARLQRAERAHHRNQDALRHAITRHEHDIARLTSLTAEIDAAIACRHDTRGEKFTMTVGGRQHLKRADAGQDLKDLLQNGAAGLDGLRQRAEQPGHLGGFPVTASIERSLGTTSITLSLDGVPGTSLQLSARDLRDADPAGLVMRLENRLGRLEERKTSTLADIEHARCEIAHARESTGKTFPQAAQLTEARDRARQIDEQLQKMAEPRQPAEPTSGEADPSPDWQLTGAGPGNPQVAETGFHAHAMARHDTERYSGSERGHYADRDMPRYPSQIPDLEAGQ